MLNELRGRLAEKQLSLAVTDAAKDFIVENGYDPVYGARPLRRYIQHELETLIARAIVENRFAAGSVVTVDVENGALTIKNS